MRGGVAVLAGGLALVVFVGIVAAGPPLVSAGLDQNVVQGDPVYLDAGGTHVPDGTLEGIEWSVEAPNGSTIEPDCVDCEVTWFRANQTGQYDVTLTAESGSGRVGSDTMYVTVSRLSAGSSSPDTDVSASGGGGSDGCFITHANIDESPLSDGICNEVGEVVDLQTSSDGDSITNFVFENVGFANDYTGASRNWNGNIVVPTRYVYSETETHYEQTQNDGDSRSYNIDTGGDNSNPTDKTKERIEENDEMDIDNCNNIPTGYC